MNRGPVVRELRAVVRFVEPGPRNARELRGEVGTGPAEEPGLNFTECNEKSSADSGSMTSQQQEGAKASPDSWPH